MNLWNLNYNVIFYVFVGNLIEWLKMLHLQRFFSMEQQKNAAAEEDPADDCLSTTGGDGDSTSAEG